MSLTKQIFLLCGLISLSACGKKDEKDPDDGKKIIIVGDGEKKEPKPVIDVGDGNSTGADITAFLTDKDFSLTNSLRLPEEYVRSINWRAKLQSEFYDSSLNLTAEQRSESETEECLSLPTENIQFKGEGDALIITQAVSKSCDLTKIDKYKNFDRYETLITQRKIEMLICENQDFSAVTNQSTFEAALKNVAKNCENYKSLSNSDMNLLILIDGVISNSDTQVKYHRAVRTRRSAPDGSPCSFQITNANMKLVGLCREQEMDDLVTSSEIIDGKEQVWQNEVPGQIMSQVTYKDTITEDKTSPWYLSGSVDIRLNDWQAQHEFNEYTAPVLSFNSNGKVLNIDLGQ
ncbi:MAG: hypothetical protein KBD78_04480 [Oligoflexales bacterium]|nr:hypothetical protein [Oligoflexales bacterium]